MGDVIKMKIITKNDISASDMLKNIACENPNHAFVVVWPNDGSMPTYHSSTSDVSIVLMRINEFVHKFYNGDFA